VRGGEQHPGRRQRSSLPRPRDALDTRRSLLRRRPRRPAFGRQPIRSTPAGAVHAVRERAVRSRMPRCRDHAQRRGPERHGLQPLRGHAVLFEQLPVQGATVQLPALRGLDDAEPRAVAQSGCIGAQPGCHGEVLVLRAAHQSGADRCQA
jgi:hypothetical protein